MRFRLILSRDASSRLRQAAAVITSPSRSRVHKVGSLSGDQKYCLFGWRTSPIIDLDGGGHAGRKDDARRHFIDMDADWDALGKAHPGEDWVDRSDPLIVGLRVRNNDGASDAVNRVARSATPAA